MNLLGALTNVLSGNKTGAVRKEGTDVGTNLIGSAVNKTFDTPSLFNIIALSPLNGDLLNGLGGWNEFSVPYADTLLNLNTSILHVSMSPISYAHIEEWIDNHWYYTTGRPELKYVELTFRDFKGNVLYNSYKDLWMRMRNMFPEDQRWVITINKRSEYKENKSNGVEVSTIMTEGNSFLSTTTAILESVGSTKLDKQNEGTYSTFTVRYKFFATQGTN